MLISYRVTFFTSPRITLPKRTFTRGDKEHCLGNFTAGQSLRPASNVASLLDTPNFISLLVGGTRKVTGSIPDVTEFFN
jgi:hypothetical protein